MATKSSSHMFLIVCFCLALTAQQAMSHGYGYGRWGHRQPSYHKPYGGYGSHGGSYGSYGSHGSHRQYGSYSSQSSYGSYGNRGSGHTSYGNYLGRPVTVTSGTHNVMRPGSQFQGSGSGVSPIQGVSGVSPVQGVSGVSPVQGVSGVSPVQGVSGVSPVQGVSGVSPVQGVGGIAPLQGSGEVSHIHLVDATSGVSGPVEPTFINSGGQDTVSDLLLGGASGTGVDVTRVDLPAQEGFLESCAFLQQSNAFLTRRVRVTQEAQAIPQQRWWRPGFVYLPG